MSAYEPFFRGAGGGRTVALGFQSLFSTENSGSFCYVRTPLISSSPVDLRCHDLWPAYPTERGFWCCSLWERVPKRPVRNIRFDMFWFCSGSTLTALTQAPDSTVLFACVLLVRFCLLVKEQGMCMKRGRSPSPSLATTFVDVCVTACKVKTYACVHACIFFRHQSVAL